MTAWSLAAGACLGFAGSAFAFAALARKRRPPHGRGGTFGVQVPRLDEKILRSKREIQSAFDSIPDGICIVDAEHNILRLNKTYAEFTGMGLREGLGSKCYRTLRELAQPCRECPMTNAAFGKGFNCNVGNRKLQIEVKPILAHGGVHHYIEIVRDVTRSESLQLQLRLSERLASIGTMVQGIAHEMNNPLSGIAGTSQLMIGSPQKYGLNERGVARVRTIGESAERAIRIVRDLNGFSQTGPIRFKPLLVSDLVDNALIAFHPDSKVSLDETILDRGLRIWGDFELLIEVMTRILSNSTEAVQERLHSKPVPPGRIEVCARRDGNRVCLMVRDNGCGVAKPAMASVFDPFFTTKEPGRGVGLSLGICHRIMRIHQGSIELRPRELGTETLLFFPERNPETRST